MRKNMKKVMAFLMVLCMAASVFAIGTDFEWYPIETGLVKNHMDRMYNNSFSRSQRDLANRYIQEVFAPVKAKLSKGSTSTQEEVVEALLRLTDDYEALKQQDAKVGEYVGAYWAQLAFATEDEDPCPFANVVMYIANNKTKSQSDRVRLSIELSKALRDDYDSFREMEIADY